jgi:hypothetical protein
LVGQVDDKSRRHLKLKPVESEHVA